MAASSPRKPGPTACAHRSRLTFESITNLGQSNQPLPFPLSEGEYGATTGLPEIPRPIDRHQVPAISLCPPWEPWRIGDGPRHRSGHPS